MSDFVEIYAVFSVVGKGTNRNERFIIACMDRSNALSECKRIRLENKTKFSNNKFVVKAIKISDC